MVNTDTNEWKCLACNQSGDDAISLLNTINRPKTSLKDYLMTTLSYMEHPDKVLGKSTGYNNLDVIWGGIRDGELSIITGGTGNGKTTFGTALIQRLSEIHEDMKFLAISGEDKVPKTFIKLASGYFKEKADKDMVMQYCEEFGDRIHLMNLYDTWIGGDIQMTAESLLQKIEYYVNTFGINFVMIDHAHLFIREGQNEIEDIRMMCQCLRKLVMTKPVHVLLVVQPTKLQADQKKVKMRNLRGSVIWEQSAWNCISVYRKSEDTHLVEVEIEKNRELGTLGTVYFDFNIETQANYKVSEA